MKKIKIILVTIFVLIISGCNASFTLNIKADESFSEKIDIYDSADSTKYKTRFELAAQNKVEAYYSDKPVGDFIPQSGSVKYYSASTYNKNGNYGVSYSYEFPKSDYNDSNALRTCVNNFDIINSYNVIKLNFKGFKCFENYSDLENLSINIKTDTEVVYSNADMDNNGVYTWIINPSNYNTKKVSFCS